MGRHGRELNWGLWGVDTVGGGGSGGGLAVVGEAEVSVCLCRESSPPRGRVTRPARRFGKQAAPPSSPGPASSGPVLGQFWGSSEEALRKEGGEEGGRVFCTAHPGSFSRWFRICAETCQTIIAQRGLPAGTAAERQRKQPPPKPPSCPDITLPYKQFPLPSHTRSPPGERLRGAKWPRLPGLNPP